MLLRGKHFATAVPVLVSLLLSATVAQKTLTASQARDHIGEQAAVCGKVESTGFAENTRGKPTFLNLDKPYPQQIFTVVIWGEDRSKFGDPETTYRGRHVCVRGKITSFKGVPEIVATEPSQIKVQQD